MIKTSTNEAYDNMTLAKLMVVNNDSVQQQAMASDNNHNY